MLNILMKFSVYTAYYHLVRIELKNLPNYSQNSQQACCKDIEEVDDACCDNEDEPDALDAEFSVLSELVVQRCCDVLEKNDLLLCKSSDCDFYDRDSAVTKERETYDEVKQRDFAVDKEEGDKEA